MKLAVEFFEILLIYVGVDLGGADVHVPQHRLDEPEVGPALQQMSRKGMAQDMGTDPLGDTGLQGILSQDLPKTLPAELSPPIVQKKHRACLLYTSPSPRDRS